MTELYDQLHSIPYHPTKHERYQTNDTRGVAFTNKTILKMHENVKVPFHSSYRNYRIKMAE